MIESFYLSLCFLHVKQNKRIQHLYPENDQKYPSERIRSRTWSFQFRIDVIDECEMVNNKRQHQRPQYRIHHDGGDRDSALAAGLNVFVGSRIEKAAGFTTRSEDSSQARTGSYLGKW